MSEREHVFLLPGELAVVRGPAHLGTLLGSCVSVVIANPHRHVAAMNHFLLPEANGATEPGRYGDTATNLIVDRLLEVDADPRHYRARLYGGAAVMEPVAGVGHIGERNVQMARRVLAERGIRVAGEDVGGTRGRRVDFTTDDGVVDCRLVGESAPRRRSDVLRVLVIDDSPVARKVLRVSLEADPGVVVVGEAGDPFEARERIVELAPDVVTLDLEMPRMDGLTFLTRLMEHHPVPVVVISSLVVPGSDERQAVLEAGACAVLDKGSIRATGSGEAVRDLLVPVLREAARTGRHGSPVIPWSSNLEGEAR